MKGQEIVACLLCVVLAAPVWAASDDSYAVQTHLGAIEGWRLAPEQILRYCSTLDPEGDSTRQEAFRQWAAEHDGLRAEVKRRFDALAPSYPLPGTSGKKAIDFARARIIIELLKMSFLGKSHEEAVAFCKTYANQDFFWWQPKHIEQVQQHLAALPKVAAPDGQPTSEP